MTDIRFIKGDARHLPIEDESVQCIVTSPPYWGLRKYAGDQGEQPYGLEPTIEAYIATTIDVLRECRRVLRKDGVLFWNIGDSYAGSGKGAWKNKDGGQKEVYIPDPDSPECLLPKCPDGLKPKDLCLIPQRVAIAAQADGWWVRSMIVWAKPNPMPESCKDRPTDAYEHIIMLTKAERYYWDADAVAEPAAKLRQEGPNAMRGEDAIRPRTKVRKPAGWDLGEGAHGTVHRDGRAQEIEYSEVDASKRNLRNVWQFATQPYSEAHFATFPEELPRRCILAATKVGDTVLDPFAGSGTVGRVAIELNRKAILNDLAYHDLSEKRTKNVQRMLISQ